MLTIRINLTNRAKNIPGGLKILRMLLHYMNSNHCQKNLP